MHRRILTLALVIATSLALASPSPAQYRHRMRNASARHHRTVLHVSSNFPIRTSHRWVTVYPGRRVVETQPTRYLPTTTFGQVYRSAENQPRPARLQWVDGERLRARDGWTQLNLNANARGDMLWLSVRNRPAQIDWAEVVFENGASRVVNFRNRVLRPGTYPLFDFRDGRAIDHVRFVARSPRGGSQLGLLMES